MIYKAKYHGIQIDKTLSWKEHTVSTLFLRRFREE